MSQKKELDSKTKGIMGFIGASGIIGISALLAFNYYKKKSLKFTIKNKDDLPENIEKYFNISLKAALEAGELIKSYINDKTAKTKGLQLKSTSADFVTVIDKKSEDLILSYIKKNFPNDDIIAEEEFSTKKTNEYNINDDKVTWCIDPIDGTTNFFYGSPITAICIGLRYKGRSILGIVHCPLLNETFFAVHNNGSYSFKNGNMSSKLRLSSNNVIIDENNKNELRNICVLTEVGYDRSEEISNSFGRRIVSVLKKEKVRAVRCLGSCAINMCFVASGRADIFYEGIDESRGPKPWDFTASECIVNEAGGYCCLTDGSPFDCTKGNIICAANKKLSDIFVKKQYAKSI